MRSCPFSQLKLKPNDAGAVNPALGGSCPPPRPVQAVSTTATMPTATSNIDRRRKEGAPLFIGVLQNCQARGPRGRGNVHDVGDFPGVQGLLSSRTGPWDLAPAIRSPPPAPARPIQDPLLRSSSTSDCYARACLRNKNGRSPPDRRTNAVQNRKLPAHLHTKHDTTATKPEHAAYPAQMLKLRRTHEFSLRLSASAALPQSAGSPRPALNTARPSSTRTYRPPRQTSGPPSKPPRAESANRARQTDPVPGRGGPERRRRPRTEGPEPAEIVVARVRTPSRTPGPRRAAAGTAGVQEPQVTRYLPLRPGTAKPQRAGFEPLSLRYPPGLRAAILKQAGLLGEEEP
jgi:hypothetical protein